MKYYSELTKTTYDTVEELQKAETKFDEAKKAEELKLQTYKAQRADAAKEVDNIYKEVVDARKSYNDACHKYNKALREFCNNYGAYHMSYDRANIDTLMDMILDAFRC